MGIKREPTRRRQTFMSCDPFSQMSDLSGELSLARFAKQTLRCPPLGDRRLQSRGSRDSPSPHCFSFEIDPLSDGLKPVYDPHGAPQMKSLKPLPMKPAKQALTSDVGQTISSRLLDIDCFAKDECGHIVDIDHQIRVEDMDDSDPCNLRIRLRNGQQFEITIRKI